MPENTSQSVRRFLTLLFILSVPLWVAGPLIEQTLGQNLPLNLPLSAFQFTLPLVTALILTYREYGYHKTKKLLRRVFDFQRIPQRTWYLPMFLVMPFVLAMSVGVMYLWGFPFPEEQTSIVWLPVFFVVFFITAACEEVGWQGFVYERLANRWSALQVGLIMGAIWSFWHIIPHIQQGYTGTWILWQSIFSVGLRLLIIWVYNNTGKSIFAATVFHMMSNVSVYLLPNDGAFYDPKAAGLSIMCVIVVIIVLWGPAAFSGSSNFERVETNRGL